MSAGLAPLRPQGNARGTPLAQRFGPILGDGETCFQLWAPGATKVTLLVEGCDAVPMARTESDIWRVVSKVGAGTRYRFDVDGLNVPDPASRFQPDDVHGPSQVESQSAYTWKNPGWAGRPWEQTVLYEVHPGLMGGFNGIRMRLAALAELGITAIELMPLADFAGARNWGYDGVLLYAPDSVYGTPDELRALIDEAHGLGLMVFLDVVYNHFGPEGNFLPAYVPTFFDATTPTPWGPAIEFDEPLVRRFFVENALYWLDAFGFDGLRLDAVHAIKHRDWLRDLAAEIRSHLPSRHVHLVLENEDNDASLLSSGYNAQWNDDFHNVMHVLLTGETHSYYQDFAHEPIQRLARCLSEGFIYQGDASLTRDGKPRGQPSGHLPPSCFVTFLQNHDQIGNRAFGERLTTLVEKPMLKAALALLLLCPQIPLLFMGEECGAIDPFLFFTDFHGELAAAVREGRRREFANAPGFDCEGDCQAIPDPNDPATFAASRVSETAPDAAEWRGWIKTLLALRHRHIIPNLPGTVSTGATVVGTKALVASWQLGNGDTLVLAVNFEASPARASLPPGQPLIGSIVGSDVIPPFTTLAWIRQ